MTSSLTRRSVLAAAGFALLMGSVPALAQDVSGELVILQWQGGTDAEMWAKLEADFAAKNPGVTVRELVVTGQGDMRGPMRTALLGGEKVDIIINTWPAFRAELADAGILRPIDDLWASAGLDSVLDQSWKDLGSTAGVTYGVNYTYGDRSAIWYKKAHLGKAGIEPPKTWDEFIASIEKLKAAGYAAPIAMPAKYWAHGEWFETLLIRNGGLDVAQKLASHEIPWTDQSVKDSLALMAPIFASDAMAGGTQAALQTEMPASVAKVFTDSPEAAMVIIGDFAPGVTETTLEPETGYNVFAFPSIEGSEPAVMGSGDLFVQFKDSPAADAFLDYLTTPEAAEIWASRGGFSSPNKNLDTSVYPDEISRTTASALA